MYNAWWKPAAKPAHRIPTSIDLWHAGKSHLCNLEIAQICALSAATGKAFTTVLAGRALTFTSFPNISLVPALVAGLTRVLILQRPGMVKMPVFLTSVVARAARLSMMPEATLPFSSCCSARVLTRAPFVITLLVDFMAFIAFMVFIGAMVTGDRRVTGKRRIRGLQSC